MMTLRQLLSKHETVPVSVTWYLAELGEAKGKQELFTRQSPQRLKVLREHAMIESAVSSNRIEGVEVDRKRIGTIMFGKPRLRDRNEEEVSGYREALKLIHGSKKGLPITEKNILYMHRLIRGETWDAGKFKERDGDIIEKHPDGTSRVRFKTLPAKETPGALKNALSLWNQGLAEKQVPPLILMAAFNLDFLCIHPFRDGNGRVSRLMLLLQCYHLGYEVGRYISIERLIEENKERYYETLDLSSRGWREGLHDPWPYIGYILFILRTAYKEFEDRLERTKSPRGEKTELIISALGKMPGEFSVADILKKSPGVSIDMVRRILKNLRAEKRIECLGRGQNARWQKTKKWGIR